MKKKQLLNIAMVATILITMICGVMAVGSVKGWFDGKEEEVTAYTVSEKSGIAMMERSGISYEVDPGTGIRPEDHVYTKNGAALTLAKGEKNGVYLSSNSEVVITDTREGFSFEVLQGETLVDARGWEGISAVSNGATFTLDGGAVAISTQTGSTMVQVYAGEITVSVGGETTSVKAGTVVTLLKDGADLTTESLKVNSLNDAQITQLKKCGLDESFCFTLADLEQVQADREAEIQKAQEEALKQQEEAKKKAEEVKAQAAAEEKKTTAEAAGTATGDDTAAAGEAEVETTGTTAKTCTIQIVCDTILSNMEQLTTGKEGYVPSNGKILGTTSAEFYEGETVFDVLQRVCNSAGIALEYSYTPIYESYYIEGINHLYEFDCGNESGWMYKVNGWFPNYGCSSYYLQDGDSIVWCYTCNGLGADVGA